MVVSIIIPILQMGNWGTKRLRDLSRVRQQGDKNPFLKVCILKVKSVAM